jgi:hypothetical protein
MRTKMVLLAALAGLAAALAVGGAASAALPAFPDYHWAQPGCAPVVTPYAQPPAWIPAAKADSPVVPGSAYHWAEPGCAVVTPGAQPPAWIPASG